MELKIAANDMLSILIDSGIDETDSKAIIFDIIQIQGAESTERKKLIEVRREREKVRKKPPTFKTQEYEDDDDDQELAPQKSRTGKRINFSNFGGAAEPIK